MLQARILSFFVQLAEFFLADLGAAFFSMWIPDLAVTLKILFEYFNFFCVFFRISVFSVVKRELKFT
jgi:hypothetical protein